MRKVHPNPALLASVKKGNEDEEWDMPEGKKPLPLNWFKNTPRHAGQLVPVDSVDGGDMVF